jgi:hypothetical protein
LLGRIRIHSLKSPEVALWRALETRFAADVVGSSMPVHRASNLALLVVGSLGARGGDSQEKRKKVFGTRVPITARVGWKLRHTTPYSSVVGHQAIKDDLANSGLRVRVVIRMNFAG